MLQNYFQGEWVMDTWSFIILSSFLHIFKMFHNTKLKKKVLRHIYQINHSQMSGKCHIFPQLGHLIGLENIKMRQWILRFWWSQSSASCTFTINLTATSPHFFFFIALSLDTSCVQVITYWLWLNITLFIYILLVMLHKRAFRKLHL